MVKPYVHVGITMDLTRRLVQHDAGQGKATTPYRPFRLVFAEEFSSYAEARVHEKFLKSGQGREFLKTLRTPNN